MKHASLVAAFVLSFFVSVVPTRAQEALPTTIPTGAKEYEVQEVRNGESIVVLMNGKRTLVSLISVDAPDPKVKPLGECFGEEARDYLTKLLPEGTVVYLEADTLDVDSQDRVTRYVWLPADGGDKPILVNGRMIRQGYAAWDEDKDNSLYADVLSRYEKEAKEKKRGIWKSCGEAHRKIQPTPTLAPTEDELKAEYAPLADVRELAIRPAGLYGQKLFFYGSIFTIQVAGPGRSFFVGDDDPQPYSAVMQVWVDAPDGTQEPVVIGFDGDTSGMFEGTYVAIYGTPVDTFSGTNAFGGSITQPLVAAEFVDIV